MRRQYVARVRQELYRGSEAAPGSAGFIEALLRFYESDSAEELGRALAGARKAQQETPWLLEPFDLEVKIRIEQLSAQLTRGQLEGNQQVEEVQATLARALDLARSYPSFYLSHNQFSLVMLKLALLSGASPQELEPIYRAGVERAKVAITLLPESGEAHDQLARLHSYWAYLKTENSQDIGDTLEQGLQVITLADKLPPERAEHYFVRGRLLDELALEKWHAGASTLPELVQSIEDLKKASSLDPGNVDYLNTQAVLTSLLARWRQEHGGDSISANKESIAISERAKALRPQLALVRSNLAALRLDLALDYFDHGIDPTPELRLGRDELQAALAINPKLHAARDVGLSLTTVELRQQLEAGHDIVAQTVELGQRHRQMVQEEPSRRPPWEGLLKNDVLYGEALLRRGSSPEPAIAVGLADIQAASRAASLALGVQADLGGQLLLLRARWLLQSGKSPLPVVAALAALPQVAPGPQCAGKLANIELNRAQLWRLVADWQSRHGQPAAATIAQGLAAVAEADRRAGSTLTRAQAERGALLALKAQTLGEPGARGQAAKEAAALLQAALRDSPPLGWQYRSYLEAAAPPQAPAQ